MSEETREKLNVLHTEINELRDEDSDLDDAMDAVADALGKLVAADDPRHESHQGVWQSLRDRITKYEAKNPEVAAFINRVATTLSDMGI